MKHPGNYEINDGQTNGQKWGIRGQTVCKDSLVVIATVTEIQLKAGKAVANMWSTVGLKKLLKWRVVCRKVLPASRLDSDHH